LQSKLIVREGVPKTVPGFRPAGALRATEFVPDKFVEPRSPLGCQGSHPPSRY